jgi:hypothetical protein
MRLTLRTLLAYMDDILDPEDHEDLGRKIESSVFATELIHRSRDAVRRLRLSAPAPLAGGGGDLHGGDDPLDANAMAEYLDNTMDPESVAEFERSCLEPGSQGDMLLAEAASCHHILTMVLGEPAEVEGDLRDRLYGLTAEQAATPQRLRIEPAHVPPTTAAAPAPVAPAAALAPTAPVVSADAAPLPASPARREVPDYLVAAARAQRRSRWLAGTVIFCALLGGVAAFLALTPEAEPPKEIASGSMGDMDDLVAAPEIGSETPETGSAPAAESEPVSPAESGSAPPFTAALAEAIPTQEPTAQQTPAEQPSTEQPTTEEPSTELPTVGAAPSDVAPPIAVPGDDAADADQAASLSATPSSTAPELPPLAADDEEAKDATAAPDSALATTPAAATDAATAPADDATEPPADADSAAEASTADDVAEAAANKPAGFYLGIDDLLLRFDARTKTWNRLPPRSPLAWGDRLAVLPKFRTLVVLHGANVYLAGGTIVELRRPVRTAGEAPVDFSLEVPAGRIIINSGLDGNRVELSSGDFRRTLALAASSSVAVDVDREFVPGADFSEGAASRIRWYLASGHATWGSGLAGDPGSARRDARVDRQRNGDAARTGRPGRRGRSARSRRSREGADPGTRRPERTGPQARGAGPGRRKRCARRRLRAGDQVAERRRSAGHMEEQHRGAPRRDGPRPGGGGRDPRGDRRPARRGSRQRRDADARRF